jgi:hypothetical protein
MCLRMSWRKALRRSPASCRVLPPEESQAFSNFIFPVPSIVSLVLPPLIACPAPHSWVVRGRRVHRRTGSPVCSRDFEATLHKRNKRWAVHAEHGTSLFCVERQPRGPGRMAKKVWIFALGWRAGLFPVRCLKFYFVAVGAYFVAAGAYLVAAGAAGAVPVEAAWVSAEPMAGLLAVAGSCV